MARNMSQYYTNALVVNVANKTEKKRLGILFMRRPHTGCAPARKGL